MIFFYSCFNIFVQWTSGRSFYSFCTFWLSDKRESLNRTADSGTSPSSYLDGKLIFFSKFKIIKVDNCMHCNNSVLHIKLFVRVCMSRYLPMLNLNRSSSDNIWKQVYYYFFNCVKLYFAILNVSDFVA